MNKITKSYLKAVYMDIKNDKVSLEQFFQGIQNVLTEELQGAGVKADYEVDKPEPIKEQSIDEDLLGDSER